MDEYLKIRIRKLVTMLEALDGIELTQKEGKFLKWLSAYDEKQINNFLRIVTKLRRKQCHNRRYIAVKPKI
jgi:hypothetical protein